MTYAQADLCFCYSLATNSDFSRRGKHYRIRSFLNIRHAHGDICKHLGIYSSTDLDDRYSNLFLNAYMNRHAHTEYLKRI